MDVIAINAVYQNGIIRPLEPLTLKENEQVKLRIFRQSEMTPLDLPVNDFAELRGIWADLGDPTYEEIEAITHQITEEHLTSLLADFDESDA